MTHIFDTNIAELYGIEEAILIHNFAFWIAKNLSGRQHIHDGRCWTFNTAQSVFDLFPEFKSLQKTKRIIKHLVDEDILVKGNYNEDKTDRTMWYAFSDKGLDLLAKFKIAQCKVQICTLQSSDLYSAKFKNERHTDNKHTDYAPLSFDISVSKDTSISQDIPPRGESALFGDVEEVEVEDVPKSEAMFDEFRKMYGGSKRGLKTEFDNFKKKTKDWKEVLPRLKILYQRQQDAKEDAREKGYFVPQEKNLSTYINQRCWEEEFMPQQQSSPRKAPNPNQFSPENEEIQSRMVEMFREMRK